jgi:hypothetical protein
MFCFATSVALRAMHNIENLRLLSLETTIKLFSAKIIPILTYGLEQIWDHLTVNDLMTPENVKVMYLKRALCLSRFKVSRLAYTMAREPFHVEELRNDLLLPSTDAFKTLLDKRQQKRDDIWWEFYSTEAMIDRDWMKSNYQLRHTTTCLAAHGFHHKICWKSNYHTPEENCICRLCDRYATETTSSHVERGFSP